MKFMSSSKAAAGIVYYSSWILCLINGQHICKKYLNYKEHHLLSMISIVCTV